jgi:uncharacterized cupredoxin-like copper-binding protein
VHRFFSRINRTAIFAVLVCMVGIALAACGDSAATATTAPPPTAPATNTTAAAANGDVQEVKLEIKEWQITPNNVEVKAGKVRFIVTNAGTMSHNITILQNGDVVGSTPTFAPSEGPKTIEVELKAGTYNMMCSLPGHAARGQTGTITVK